MKRSNINSSPTDNHKKQRFSGHSLQSQSALAYQQYGGSYPLNLSLGGGNSLSSASPNDIYNPYAPTPSYPSMSNYQQNYGASYANSSSSYMGSGGYSSNPYGSGGISPGYGAGGVAGHDMGMPYSGGMGAGQYGSMSGAAGYGSSGVPMMQQQPLYAPPSPNHRTIYIGNLPAGSTVSEVLNYVKGGPVDNARILEEKNCAFITFLDSQSALNAFNHLSQQKVYVREQEVKIGWGKPIPLPGNIAVGISQGASRNVYIGNLADGTTEADLRRDLSQYGTIDIVKLVKTKDKLVGFVHFTATSNAMKCVSGLSLDPRFAGKRINYGKDRCSWGNASGTPQGNPMGNAGPQRGTGGRYGGDMAGTTAIDPALQSSNALSLLPFGLHTTINPTNKRIVYLGGVTPEISTTDLCNVIRGGTLERIHILPEKSCAFINFVDPLSASIFYHLCTTYGIAAKSKRLKIGWGKTSNPIHSAVLQAVQAGASRNVYVGGLEPHITVELLQQIFSQFGEVEHCNILADKQCGFVNFTDIKIALKAVEELKKKQADGENISEFNVDPSNWKISFGKDRCGNFPRIPRNGPISATNDSKIGKSSTGGDDLPIEEDENHAHGDVTMESHGIAGDTVKEDDIEEIKHEIHPEYEESKNFPDFDEIAE